MHLFSDPIKDQIYPQVEAVIATPADMQHLRYAYGNSPWGSILSAHCNKGICYLAFADDAQQAFQEMQEEFSWAISWQADENSFDMPMAGSVSVCIWGSSFQQQVWLALLKIPPASSCSYEALALQMGLEAKHARAIGTAVGSNRIAWLIPCHRVMGKQGKLSGFRWGLNRKRMLLRYEQGI